MNRLPRVMHTVAGLKSSAGGTSQAVQSTCSELAKAGVEVSLVSQDFGLASDPNVLPAETVRVGFSRASILPFTKSVFSAGFRLLVKETCVNSRIDIVHDHGLWLPSNHAVASVCRTLGLPRVVSPHGMLSDDALNYGGVKKFLAWKLFQWRDLQSSAAICVTSTQEADQVQGMRLGRPIAVIPPGIELPALRIGTARGSGRKVALFLGRIHPMKGLLNLVRAWDSVRPQGWRVVIAGPDESGHQKTVQDAIDRANLGDVFEFAGPAYNTAKSNLYETASLFVLPSFSENFGMSIAEALAYELPVITTVGTPWKSIQQQGCGWWVNATSNDLADAIRKAASLPEAELKSMGRRGRVLIQRDFDWSKIAPQFISLYRWLLGYEQLPEHVIGTQH